MFFHVYSNIEFFFNYLVIRPNRFLKPVRSCTRSHLASVGLKGVPPFSNLQLQNQPEAYQCIHSQDASEGRVFNLVELL